MIMNLLKSTTKLAIARLTTKPAALFAGDSWKERDEAAEKVYINRRESNSPLI
jgi:hypothetical protein